GDLSFGQRHSIQQGCEFIDRYLQQFGELRFSRDPREDEPLDAEAITVSHVKQQSLTLDRTQLRDFFKQLSQQYPPFESGYRVCQSVDGLDIRGFDWDYLQSFWLDRVRRKYGADQIRELNRRCDPIKSEHQQLGSIAVLSERFQFLVKGRNIYIDT